MTEKELQRKIVKLARLHEWRIAHFTATRTSSGVYLTPQSGDKGFPDLVLLKPPRLIFVELKSARGWVNFEQATWLNSLEACGVEQYVWRPKDLDSGAIEDVLGRASR